MPTLFRAHSWYSFLRGLPSPKAVAEAAARAGYSAVLLADHHGLTGTLEFQDACLEHGLQPLLGLTVHIARSSSRVAPATLSLIAMDEAGWANLCQISSLAQTRPDRDIEHGVPLSSILSHSQGLLCLADVQDLTDDSPTQGPVWLTTLHNTYGDRLHLCLDQRVSGPHGEAAQGAAQRLGIPLIGGHQVYYIEPEQHDLQRTLAAIRVNQPRTSLSAGDAAPQNAYLPSAAELWDRYADIDGLTDGDDVAARCSLSLPKGRHLFPALELPDGLSDEEQLRRQAVAGAMKLYGVEGRLPERVRDRLDHELDIIASKGFAPIFLVMQEVIAYARRDGVPSASRGSASSSLVAHCLDITTPDPLALNLYFERFLNPARATPPDIDTDLCSRRRDRVIDHVFEQYGRDRVAMVATINCLKERSALREVAKAFGIPSDKLVDDLPYRWFGPRPNRGRQGGPYDVLRKHSTEADFQRMLAHAEALIGQPDHLSIHPGGIVIAPRPIRDICPVNLAGKGITITQFDLDGIERLGLIKLDLLGIRGLTVVADVAEALLDDGEPAPATPSPGRSVAPMIARLDAIPNVDADTSELIRSGRTIGCFQIESGGMRNTLRDLQARSIDDVLAALALFRPGPIQGGLRDAYVRRHLGREPVEHIHPALAPLLDETLGVILYQEQVLRIAHELAGLSLADADLLRRAMSHFDPGEKMRTLRDRFIAGAEVVSQVPSDVGLRIWDMMAAFAGYGFPKAHAASYAVAAWRSAWCKAHHPALFMAAVLANWGGYYSQRVYLTEARRLGLTLRPPHVNHSRHEFTVVMHHQTPTLYMGLNQVRELTRRTIAGIERGRPFRSLDDFLTRVDPRPVEAEHLARVDAFAGLIDPQRALERLKGGWSAGQPGLFETFEAEGDDSRSLTERVTDEEEILGAAVSAHPLELAAGRYGEALTTVQAAARTGETVKVAAMRQTWRRTRNAQGERVYHMVAEDLEGMIDCVIPNVIYDRHRAAFSTGPGPFVLEGEVVPNAETGEAELLISRVAAIGNVRGAG